MYKLKLASFAIPIRSHVFPGVLILEAATPPPQEQMSIFVHTHTPIGVSAAIILCAKSTDFLFLRSTVLARTQHVLIFVYEENDSFVALLNSAEF